MHKKKKVWSVFVEIGVVLYPQNGNLYKRNFENVLNTENYASETRSKK